MKKTLPPEILSQIFDNSDSLKFLREFEPYFTKKTKDKLLSPSRVVSTGNLAEVKRLKYFGVNLTRKNLLEAVDQGYADIAKYIHKNYSRIELDDIVRYVSTGKSAQAIILLNIKKLTTEEFVFLFGQIHVEDHHMVSIVMEFSPIKRKFSLSELLLNNLHTVFLLVDRRYEDFTTVLLQTGKVNADDYFIYYLLTSHHFDFVEKIVNTLDLKLSQRLIKELNIYIQSRNDGQVNDFLVSVLKIYDINY